MNSRPYAIEADFHRSVNLPLLTIYISSSAVIGWYSRTIGVSMMIPLLLYLGLRQQSLALCVYPRIGLQIQTKSLICGSTTNLIPFSQVKNVAMEEAIIRFRHQHYLAITTVTGRRHAIHLVLHDGAYLYADSV